VTHIGEFCAAGETRQLLRLAAATEGGEVECALPCIEKTAFITKFKAASWNENKF
jgi:hypothetical protein